jgi:hypothetical protein
MLIASTEKYLPTKSQNCAAAHDSEQKPEGSSKASQTAPNLVLELFSHLALTVIHKAQHSLYKVKIDAVRSSTSIIQNNENNVRVLLKILKSCSSPMMKHPPLQDVAKILCRREGEVRVLEVLWPRSTIMRLQLL